MKNLLLSVLGPTTSTAIQSVFGPKLIMVLAIPFLVLWGWAKFTSTQLEQESAAHEKTKVELQTSEELAKRLDNALKEVSALQAQLSALNTASEQDQVAIQNDPDASLDTALPESVLRILRDAADEVRRAAGDTELGFPAVGPPRPLGL